MVLTGIKKGGPSSEASPGRDHRRHSSIVSDSLFPPSDHLPRSTLSMDHLPSLQTAGKAERSRELGLQPPTNGTHDNTRDSNSDDLSTQERTPRLQRFSLLKFRHASDSHLSTTYAQAEPPPVPNIPPTPTIITTSPTTNTLKEPPKKPKNKFKILSRSPRSSQDSLASDRPKLGLSRHTLRNSKASEGSHTNLRSSNPSFEDPSRLSTSSIRGAPPAYGDESNSALALPVSRVSESSRSDGSSGDHGIYATTTTTHTVSTTTTFFRIPRRKKDKGPLFPLPMKVAPSGASAGATPRASTSGRSSQSQGRPSMGSNAGPLTAIFRPPDEGSQLNTGSAVPSPAHSTLALSASNTGSSPVLHRQSSTASVHSAQSQRHHGLAPLNKRSRSSTMGSPSGIPDDHPDMSHANPSVRTSTSTSGRKSFGDLFGLTHRLRQNSEPPIPRHGSPGGMPGTPGSTTSKTNSFSMIRETPFVCPPREEGETPAQYLDRLEKAVSRSVIATVLSKTNDEFSHTALRRYMRGFAFFGDPIDMAVRKMLMEVELPKETQHIDRVLQSFADRYHECNPGIFSSPEQAYFIAFSILILHTDIFNKSNKNKMQRQDYIKNTAGEGVAEDILGCFYDNIAYTPFIHVEDDPETKERLLAPKSKKSSLFKVPSTDQLRKGSKDPVDPYNLIIDGKLDTLRPSLKDVMDLEDNYNFLGTADRFNMAHLHLSFSVSSILQIVSTRSRPDAFMTQATISNPAESHPGVVDIRVAKVGLLWRKDPRKKKTRSPWQEWGVLLTNSSVYFFRDVNWIKSLITQYDYHQKQSKTDHPCVFQPQVPLQDFKPDTLMSTEDAVALQDASYTKHKHSFQFIRHGKLEEVFLANSEVDKNDWLAHLNYAATFRSCGVRMRGNVGFNYETQRNKGLSRVDSHRSTRSAVIPTGEVSLQNTRMIDPQLALEIITARRQVMVERIGEMDDKLVMMQKQLDGQLRNARHLQILAPIQARTREQIILAAGRMSARVKWSRMDIWRTKCHREILSLDFDEDSRHLQRSQLKELKEGSKIASTPSKAPPSLSQQSLNRFDTRSSGPAPASPKSTRSTQMQLPRPTSSAEKASTAESLSPTNSIASQRASSTRAQANPEAQLLSPEAFELASDGSFSVSPSRHPSHSLLHHASLQSTKSKSDQSATAPVSSPRSTPAPSVDGGEEQVLREAGLVSVETTPGKRIETSKESEKERDRSRPISPTSPEFNSPDSRSKVRRSLHRTLRDSHHGSQHHRSRKGRDSASTIAGADDNASITAESEVLTRASGSFVVHGKKASVITFGSEWQSMSPEERLKLRRQAHSEDGKLMEHSTTEDDDADDSFVDVRTGSINSGSAQTARSALSRRGSESVEQQTSGTEDKFDAEREDLKETGRLGTNGSGHNEVEEAESTGSGRNDFGNENTDETGDITRHAPVEQDVGA